MVDFHAKLQAEREARRQDRERKLAEEKSLRISQYKKADLTVVGSRICTLKEDSVIVYKYLAPDTETCGHFVVKVVKELNADNHEAQNIYSAAFITLQNKWLTRTSRPGTNYILTIGPIPTLRASNSKLLPVPDKPNLIADMYGQSLISKTERFFNAPYFGDYFDQYNVHAPFYPADPSKGIEDKDFYIDVTTEQIARDNKYTVIQKTMKKPVGLSEIVNTGYNDELTFMLDMELAKLVKDSKPWLKEGYDPYEE